MTFKLKRIEEKHGDLCETCGNDEKSIYLLEGITGIADKPDVTLCKECLKKLRNLIGIGLILDDNK